MLSSIGNHAPAPTTGNGAGGSPGRQPDTIDNRKAQALRSGAHYRRLRCCPRKADSQARSSQCSISQAPESEPLEALKLNCGGIGRNCSATDTPLPARWACATEGTRSPPHPISGISFRIRIMRSIQLRNELGSLRWVATFTCLNPYAPSAITGNIGSGLVVKPAFGSVDHCIGVRAQFRSGKLRSHPLQRSRSGAFDRLRYVSGPISDARLRRGRAPGSDIGVIDQADEPTTIPKTNWTAHSAVQTSATLQVLLRSWHICSSASIYTVTRNAWSNSANQPHEVFNLFCDPRPVRTKVLLKANSAKERDDEASERIIVVTNSTRCG